MINVTKKNPYVFTIGFDETDPVHIRAAEILNGTKKKAQLIADAILSYVDGDDSEGIPDFHVEALEPLLEKLIQKELKKVMRDQLTSSDDKMAQLSESVLDLSPEEKRIEMDESITQNIMDAMDVFRRNC